MVKYPRTYHAPWSASIHRTDKIIQSTASFLNKEVIVSEKMDGECTTFGNDYIHARSLTSSNHFTRDWVKGFHAKIKHEIPDGYRICGENMFAKHSIFYDNLENYFYGFSAWDSENFCLDWKSTEELFKNLSIIWPKILYFGIYDEAKIKSITNHLDLDKIEGYVVRLTEKFHYDDFGKSVMKYVRSNHVQTDEHWLYDKRIEINKLRA